MVWPVVINDNIVPKVQCSHEFVKLQRNQLRRWTGRAALILGIINFYIGVYMYYDGDSVNKGLHLYIAAAAILGTFIVIAILKDGYAYLRKPISQATSKGGVELVAGQVGETDYSVMDTGNLANNGTHTA